MAAQKYKFHSYVKDYDPKEGQTLGARIAKVAGSLEKATPAVVLEDAKNPESPLHKHFEWDNKKAAEQHRLAQAKKLLSSLYTVTTRTVKVESPVLEVVADALKKAADARRVPAPVVPAVVPSTRAAMRQAHDELIAWAKKYKGVHGLKPALLYVNKAIGTIDTID